MVPRGDGRGGTGGEPRESSRLTLSIRALQYVSVSCGISCCSPLKVQSPMRCAQLWPPPVVDVVDRPPHVDYATEAPYA